jgi:predicted ArsR family transcriptional regulator
MLSHILKLLEEKGPMSLAEIANGLQCDVDAVRGMAELLEKKGRIEQLDTKCSKCKGCVEVRPEDALIFKSAK